MRELIEARVEALSKELAFVIRNLQAVAGDTDNRDAINITWEEVPV